MLFLTLKTRLPTLNHKMLRFTRQNLKQQCCQVVQKNTHLSTNVATMRSFPCMNPLVYHQIISGHHTFIAIGTFVRGFPRMNPHVDF